MYTVVTSESTREFNRRQDAIISAKRISQRRHETVKILRRNGAEKMFYRNGRLEEGVYLTPDRRRRRR